MRVLLLCPQLPYPPDHGASQRTYLLYRALETLGHVDLVWVEAPPETDLSHVHLPSPFTLTAFFPREERKGPTRLLWPAYNALRTRIGGAAWINRVRKPWQEALAELLRRGRYDVVVCRYLQTALRTNALQHPTVFVDVDDLDSELWKSGALTLSRSGQLLQSHLTRIAVREECKALERCTGVWFTKPSDAARYSHLNHAVLPNIPFPFSQDFKASADPPPVLGGLFAVGQLSYPPNQRGFQWFFDEVWPLILASYPTATLMLAGQISDSGVRARWSRIKGVTLLGRVESLAPYYRASVATIAPIREGGGTLIKVLEALDHRKLCICTPEAARGTEGLAGISTAHSAEAFAQSCVQALHSPAFAHEMGEAGYASMQKNHTFEHFKASVAKLVRLTPHSQ